MEDLSSMHISEINIYPIKSLKGIALQEAVVEDRGLRFDRRWMLVDRDGMFFTQRDFPVMATIVTAVGDSGLRVSKGGHDLRIPLEPDNGEPLTVTVWDSRVSALAYSGEVSDWFSEAIGTDCKLVLMPADSRREVDAEYAVQRGDDIVSFADGYPFLLIGEGSLADLNSRMEMPLPMNRFRPNLVAAGSDPFAEDTWKKIRIGETTFHVVKPCDRCVTTTVDQARGEKDGKEPLKTLAAFRKQDGKVMFGQNLIAEKAGDIIRVGAEIEVLERKPFLRDCH